MLKIKGLKKCYGDKMVLNNINLNLMPGEIYGVIGKNGAGKSTLFRCICKLEKFRGEISFKNSFGVGYMPTDPYFFPKLTGKEYLEFFVKMSPEPKHRKSEINDFNCLFKLPLNEFVHSYSTGMKKRLCFLGLIIQRHKIYILDEPFNGLDLEGVMLFKEIIQELKSKGALILISSHIVESLTSLCGTIKLLERGLIKKEYSVENFGLIEKEMNLLTKQEKYKINQLL